MEAHVFHYGSDHNPNGGRDISKVCVDRKVHLTLHISWRNQWGGPCFDKMLSTLDTVHYGDLTPCDGSCLPMCTIPVEAEELVRKFLASDGKERGEYQRTTPRFSRDATADPDAIDDE